MIIDPGLLNHINHRINDHESIEHIRQTLVEVGWDEAQVNFALTEVTTARENTSENDKGNPQIFHLHNNRDGSPLAGRLSIRQYLVGVLLITLVDTVIIFGLVKAYLILPHTPEINTLFFSVSLFVFLINTFTLISITVRRLHDMGYGNTWALFLFLPVINIVFLIFLCAPGSKGNNNYGADPRYFSMFRTLLNK